MDSWTDSLRTVVLTEGSQSWAHGLLAAACGGPRHVSSSGGLSLVTDEGSVRAGRFGAGARMMDGEAI
jgi:hypothetical protein